MSQLDSTRIATAGCVLRCLLSPWRTSAKQNPQKLLTMAIALEGLALELRQEASKLPDTDGWEG